MNIVASFTKPRHLNHSKDMHRRNLTTMCLQHLSSHRNVSEELEPVRPTTSSVSTNVHTVFYLPEYLLGDSVFFFVNLLVLFCK